VGEPSLALQKAIGVRLIASGAVTALVPADAIVDRSGAPELDRCIMIGEAQTVHADRYRRFYDEAFASLHIWVKEPGLLTAKKIGGAIIDTLIEKPFDFDGYRCTGMMNGGSRYMRDPHGVYSHGIVTIRAIVRERAA
jgi:hypothetical protein